MRPCRAACAGAAVLLFAAVGGNAEVFFDARVIAVIDGDTLDVAGDDGSRRIRVAGIDSPERRQPWGERSKRALADRVLHKEVRINAVATDRYGRTVGEIYADDVCVGCELVREGHAWVYRAFTDDPTLLELEAEARSSRRGLWSLPEDERVPPWEWRARRRGAGDRRISTPVGEDGSSSFACGEKRTCGEMATCAEARFQLERCNLTALDGDGDGVPCESLCR